MKQVNRKTFYLAVCMLLAFAVWTGLVCVVDVQTIGPQGSSVGFSTINGFFHNLIGVNVTLYDVTDWLGLGPLLFVAGFALLGLVQWIKWKRISKVDRSILVLGGVYLVVLAVFVLFEKLAINYRPVLIEGVLEASYPSSTTMMVLAVMPTALMQLNARIQNKQLKRALTVLLTVFIAFMVIGRILSGVHWVTDIIGGALFSTGMVLLYHSLTNCRSI